MSRIMLLLCTTICFGLVACAKPKPINTNPSSPASPEANAIVSLPSWADPDGDNDNKGHAYFPETRPATGGKVFIFDPNYHAWAVYDAEGNRVNTGKASGGSLYCPDLGRPCKTIVGTFHVLNKQGADCKSHIFPLKTHGGAPMPYCMLFDGRGYAVHGSYEIPDYNASHGCIRITPTAAKWLNQDFMSVGTTVIVLPYQSSAPSPSSVPSNLG